MNRLYPAVLAIVLAASSGSPLLAQTVHKSAHYDYRVVTVVPELVPPWSIAFLPDGDLLITERPGRLRIVRNGTLLPQPVDGVPKVFHSRQGGWNP